MANLPHANQMNDAAPIPANQGDGMDIYAAARAGLSDRVTELVQGGVDPSEADASGYTAMRYAVVHEHIEVVNALLHAGVDPDDLVNNDNSTALSLAAANRCLNIAVVLLAAGADVNSDGPSLPPLVAAADSGDIDIMMLLLRAGAEVNPIVVEGPHETALMSAAEDGFIEGVNSLLAYGADVSLLDGDGFNALFRAAKNGQMECVAALLEAGADIHSVVRETGATALMVLAEYNDFFTDEIQIMLDAGLNIDAVDILGNTALMIATMNDNTQMVSFLMDAGADFTIRNLAGQDALMLATDQYTLNVLTEAIANIGEVVGEADAGMIAEDEESVDNESLPPLEAATPITEGDMDDVVEIAGLIQYHPDAI